MIITPPPSDNDDAWFDSEQPTRTGAVAELQRIQRRTFNRPWAPLLFAFTITSLLTYKIYKKKPIVEATIVLQLSQGSLHTRETPIPVDELRDYVSNILLDDKKLLALIERRHLFPLRAKAGNQFAIDELRDQMTITVWKNSFVFYDEDNPDAEREAHIGISVDDTDADDAYERAQDLASIAIETFDEKQQEIGDAIQKHYDDINEGLQKNRADIERSITVKQAAMRNAREAGQNTLAAVFLVNITQLQEEAKRVDIQLGTLTNSREGYQGDIADSGLDVSLRRVDEYRPEQPEKSGLAMIMIAAIVGTCSFLGAAMVFGSFDARVHETDDVARLGLPVLGHVPGFPGDTVGSLVARGAARPRVPLFRRWRSHR
ncbi:MAG TPA: hypothetical protein VGM88_24245 [Kofleriaceae bacterium]|jgi:hypothetical protein